MPTLLMLLLTVVLAPPFGEAEATAVSAQDGLILEVRVEVAGNPDVVLARGVSLGGELPPLALSEIASGEWAGIVTLDAAENISVAFEAIYSDGTAAISEVHSLVALGVDAAVFGAPPPPAATTTTTTSDIRFAGDTVPWLILATLAGLGALLLIGAWTFLGRKGSSFDKLSGETDNSGNTDNEESAVASPREGDKGAD